MGRVIDAITSGKLTNQILLLNLVYLLLAAIGMYYLRYVWRMYILATSYRLGQIMRSRLFEHFTKMSPSFYQKYRTGDLMAHATNDINSLTRLAGGGVMSAWMPLLQLGNPNHYVFQHFLADDTSGCLTPTFHGFCD